MPRGVDRLDEARLQGRLWTPAHLPTRPVVWWESGFGATPEATINRGSLGGSFAQATSGSRPAVVPNGINGRPLLNFATSKSQETGNLSNTGASIVTVFAAGIFSTSATKPIVSWCWRTFFTGWAVYTGQAVGNFDGGFDPVFAFDSSSIRDGKVHSQLIQFGAGPQRAWLDGAEIPYADLSTPYPCGSITDQPILIGQGGDGEFGDHPGLGIVLVVDGAQTPADVERIAGWGHWKLRREDALPGTSPYRSRPPLIGA